MALQEIGIMDLLFGRIRLFQKKIPIMTEKFEKRPNKVAGFSILKEMIR